MSTTIELPRWLYLMIDGLTSPLDETIRQYVEEDFVPTEEFLRRMDYLYDVYYAR